jgi:hypothetical protein
MIRKADLSFLEKAIAQITNAQCEIASRFTMGLMPVISEYEYQELQKAIDIIKNVVTKNEHDASRMQVKKK